MGTKSPNPWEEERKESYQRVNRSLRSIFALASVSQAGNGLPESGAGFSYLWLVGNGRMVLVVTVVIIVPHSSIPY